jgi:hypothetical protein
LADFKIAVFESAHFVHLPRLHWLAPYCLNELAMRTQAQISADLTAFWQAADSKQAGAGQLIACVVQQGDVWREVSRGFVMPAKNIHA